MALGPGELDVAVFTGLAGRGRAAARAGDTTGARALFGQALGLWRGPALADAAPMCPVLAGEAARLEETRLAVAEERIACDLLLGRHAEVAGELAGLVSECPLRERLVGLLMTALYRCGRRGEALAVFDTARRVLAEQLGLDPGPELAGLQAKVLADDPTLAAPAPAAAPRSPLVGNAVPVPRSRMRSAQSTDQKVAAAVRLCKCYRSAPLRRLHSPQSSWRLSTVVAPPRVTGMTWSYCRSNLLPHSAHWPPSRSNTARRTSRGMGWRCPWGRGCRPSSTLSIMWARSRR